MLRFGLFLLAIGTALAGVPYTTYLNTAGVGYSRVDSAAPPVYLSQVGYTYSNVYSMPRALVANAPHVVVAPTVETSYTAALVPEHLPAEANVNLIDIHHPKVSTRKFEIRRPAIEKQFYDIEERIVVRPAGKAVVELEQPVSKQQRGPAVVSSVSAVNTVLHPLPVSPVLHTPVHQAGVVHPPLVSPPQPPQNVFLSEQPQQGTFQQENFPQQPENEQPSQFDDSDSVTIENAEIASARSQLQQPNLQQPNSQQFQSGFARTGTNHPSQRFQFDVVSQQQNGNGQLERRPSVELFRSQQSLDKRLPSSQNEQVQTRLLPVQPSSYQNAQQFEQSNPQLFQYHQYSRTSSQPLRPLDLSGEEKPRSGDVYRQSQDFTAKFRTQNVSNQERLIDLLTARGGVTEVRGYGENEGGNQVRARVLSVTASPLNVEQADEKVSTRRIVVNRPITTVEEVDVIEPFTKVERVAVNQPALIKTSPVNVPAVPVQHYAYTVSPLIH